MAFKSPSLTVVHSRFFAWAAGVLLVLGVITRIAYYDTACGMPDEVITTAVVQHMRQTGDWDVNWSKADVDPGFRYDQYNFSSYIYSTYFFYRVVKLIPGTESWRSRDHGVPVYRMFSALLACLVLVEVYLISKRWSGLASAAAMLVCSFAPILVQDAHYIRPESFLTVLTLAAVGLSLRSQSSTWYLYLGAFCVGLAVACKISMILLLCAPLLALVGQWRVVARPGRALGMILFLALAGFALGAPGALYNNSAFINGVKVLQHQYAGIHLPHSHEHGGPVMNMLLAYFGATLGWCTLGCGILGVCFLVRDQLRTVVVLATPILLFVALFGAQSVFFERNLSHVVPLVGLLAGVGVEFAVLHLPSRAPSWIATISIVLFAVLIGCRPLSVSWRLIRTEYTGAESARRDRLERQVRAANPGAVWHDEWGFNDGLFSRLPASPDASPVLLRISDYSDEITARNLKKLRADFDAQLVAEYPGTFADVPTSTLQTYFSQHEMYFLVRGPVTLQTR